MEREKQVRPSGLFAILASVMLAISVLMLTPLWMQAGNALFYGDYPRITVILYLTSVGLQLFWLIYCLCDFFFCRDSKTNLCLLIVVTLVVLISVMALNLSAFVLTCTEFGFWWHQNGSAGRAFFVLSILNMCTSMFSSGKSLSKSE